MFAVAGEVDGAVRSPDLSLDWRWAFDPRHPLHRIMRSLSIWEPEPNLAASAESWITAGDPQHTELSTAAEIHQLVDFATCSRLIC